MSVYAIVIRGPALSGKTALARRLAERLPGKVAVLSQDELQSRWIVGHDEDFASEVELVYRQIKLLAASYVRGGYHMVIEGPFAAYRDGQAALHESDLRELLGLLASVPSARPLFVSLTASLETLRARVEEDGRWSMDAVESFYAAFARSPLASAVEIDTSVTSLDAAVDQVLVRLRR